MLRSAGLFRRSSIAFVASFAMGAVTFSTRGAEAVEYRNYRGHAATCMIEYPDDTEYYMNSDGTMEGLRTNRVVRFYCPWPDGTFYSAYYSTALSVHVYNPDVYAPWAKACVTYYDTSGGTCGTTYYGSSSAGNQTLTPALTAWNDSANIPDYKYTVVSISNTSSIGRLKGIFGQVAIP